MDTIYNQPTNHYHPEKRNGINLNEKEMHEITNKPSYLDIKINTQAEDYKPHFGREESKLTLRRELIRKVRII